VNCDGVRDKAYPGLTLSNCLATIKDQRDILAIDRSHFDSFLGIFLSAFRCFFEIRNPTKPQTHCITLAFHCIYAVVQKFRISTIFNVFKISLFCSPRLRLFD